MYIEIKHRHTGLTLYACELPKELEYASKSIQLRFAVITAVNEDHSLAFADLREADLSNADLSRADLSNADLTDVDLPNANLRGAYLICAALFGAHLSNADLHGANLSYANLSYASLSRAYLICADLTGANLTGANLTGANLTSADLSRACLSGTDLTGAALRGANLSGIDLSGANLNDIYEDFFDVLSWAKDEVPALIDALKNGRVDGSTYAGPCACLVGTIANARNVDYSTLPHASGRPIERFFSAIAKGDTPTTNPVSAIVTEWAENWLANQS